MPVGDDDCDDHRAGVSSCRVLRHGIESIRGREAAKLLVVEYRIVAIASDKQWDLWPEGDSEPSRGIPTPQI